MMLFWPINPFVLMMWPCSLCARQEYDDEELSSDDDDELLSSVDDDVELSSDDDDEELSSDDEQFSE